MGPTEVTPEPKATSPGLDHRRLAGGTAGLAGRSVFVALTAFG
jgi:hypothetical protein